MIRLTFSIVRVRHRVPGGRVTGVEMRSGLILAGFVFCVAFAVPASAQSPLDGPLAAPDAPVGKPAGTPSKHAKAKPRKQRHAAAGATDTRSRNAAPFDGQPSSATPTAAAVPHGDPSGNPLSLGMKWQGNNDSAGETRYQNLDGNAFGSGAEVGMKLHF